MWRDPRGKAHYDASPSMTSGRNEERSSKLFNGGHGKKFPRRGTKMHLARSGPTTPGRVAGKQGFAVLKKAIVLLAGAKRNGMKFNNMATSAGGRKSGMRIDPLGSNTEIGRKLKQYYDDLISEDVPDRFAQLLQQLEEQEHSPAIARDGE